ncbi:hypothetical protein [Limnohabitans sp. 15K]|uniref:hypothetical protein n=1 Tax=Limnohabitans sp. 15K TaxID=1100706 RepID=UPI00117B3F3F|nr:hypothetical protein [Limnohabitans sp. 15K]
MFKVLLRPFSYLTISHPDRVHFWVNWGFPIAVAVVTGGAWLLPSLLDYLGYIKPNPTDIWSGSGFISKIQSFVQNLPGFYTAALAAVATFGGKEMLRPMSGNPPKMRFLIEGALTDKLELNRRLFLAVMFAYLTMLSFLLTIGAALALTLAPAIKAALIPALIPWFSALATSIYILFFVQLLTVTAWGLYYLGEKMHLSDGADATG